MASAIPFFGDTIAICNIVWTVVSAYQDAPETFKNFSIHVRQVGDTVKGLQKRERETKFFRDLDEDSKKGLNDKLADMNDALSNMREIQSDYNDIERGLRDKAKKDQTSVQGGLRASLRETLGGRPSPPKPEKIDEFAKRKWKQTKFSLFKMDEIATYQANLDRHLISLTLFLEGENLAINLESRNMLRALVASKQASQPLPSLQTISPISSISLPPRQKISCLFVDSTNTHESILAHAYADLIKLWTLDNLADSPFGTTSSAGLHVRSSLITSSLFPSQTLSTPGQRPSRSAITLLFPGTQEADEMCSAKFVGSHCSEVRRTKARTYAHASRGICVDDFVKFDLIVACNEEIFLELEALKDIVTHFAASKPGQRLPNAKLRLLRLPDVGHGSREEVGKEVEAKMIQFARNETSWWTKPTRKMGLRRETNCAFRTRQAVVAMGSEELTRKVGSMEGVFVFVEPIDGKESEESLLTVTGKYGKMDRAFMKLEQRLPIRNF